MRNAKTNSQGTKTFLIETPHGTCELLVRRLETHGIPTYQPYECRSLSGQETSPPDSHLIAQAIALDEWAAEHAEVFVEARTSFT